MRTNPSVRRAHSSKSHHHAARHKSKVRGFTIIEVMIVLAIAGLIMLVVFIAVPSVQKSARDAGRKQTASVVLTELNEYKSFHANQYPSAAERCQFMKSNLSEFVDSSASCIDGGCTDGILLKGRMYDFCFHDAETSPHSYLSSNEDEISIQTGHWCTNRVGVTSNTGDPIQSLSIDTDLHYGVVWVPLEKARLFCIDNH